MYRARCPLVWVVYMYLNALTFRGQSFNDEILHWAPSRRHYKSPSRIRFVCMYFVLICVPLFLSFFFLPRLDPLDSIFDSDFASRMQIRSNLSELLFLTSQSAIDVTWVVRICVFLSCGAKRLSLGTARLRLILGTIMKDIFFNEKKKRNMCHIGEWLCKVQSRGK